jgi:hypothetical protein
VLIGPALHVIEPRVLADIARRACVNFSHGRFFSAPFWRDAMGLLSWLVTAARDTISQIFLVAMITGYSPAVTTHFPLSQSCCLFGKGANFRKQAPALRTNFFNECYENNFTTGSCKQIGCGWAALQSPFYAATYSPEQRRAGGGLIDAKLATVLRCAPSPLRYGSLAAPWNPRFLH